MYLVTQRTPTKTISTELFNDQLNAEIMRDVINAQCDEYSGATIEELYIKDLESSKSKKIQFQEESNNHECYDEIPLSFWYDGTESVVYININAVWEMDRYGDLEWSWTLQNEFRYVDTKEVVFVASTQVFETVKKLVGDWIDEYDLFSYYLNDEIRSEQAYRNA
jgi:hypothetical protein